MQASAWTLLVCAAVCLALRLALARRTFDATALLYVRAPVDAAAFRIRQALAWRRGPPRDAVEPKSDLFVYAGPRASTLAAREQELREAYALGRLRATSTREVYRENLYVLDLLDRLGGDAIARLLPPPGRGVVAVDVGSKDFRYAFALARWLELARERRDDGEAPETEPRRVELTGVELDGYPIYADLHSRADHGEAYAREVDGATVSYEVGDFLDRDDRDLDVVFFFFPFVLRYALVRWGLPLSCFAPERMFARAREALRPGGLLVVANHTREERRRQLALLEETGFEILGSYTARSEMVAYAADAPERTLTFARRRP